MVELNNRRRAAWTEFHADHSDPKAGVLLSPMFVLFIWLLAPLCGQSFFVTHRDIHTLFLTYRLLCSSWDNSMSDGLWRRCCDVRLPEHKHESAKGNKCSAQNSANMKKIEICSIELHEVKDCPYSYNFHIGLGAAVSVVCIFSRCNDFHRHVL